MGIGPGGGDSLSLEASQILSEAEVVIGYDTYINLIKSFIDDKQVYCYSMTQEVDRCKKALSLAETGWKVALISSGDPGVYGMAGLLLELNDDPRLPIKIIPGITAATGVASVLGAPLVHDFCVISLSDLLTPWETIDKRLHAASKGDFVIVLYNPKSNKRTNHLARAREIIIPYRGGDTPVGIVSNSYRTGETKVITSLDDLLNYEVSMSSTVIIGNSMSYQKFGRMITPRGYQS